MLNSIKTVGLCFLSASINLSVLTQASQAQKVSTSPPSTAPSKSVEGTGGKILSIAQQQALDLLMQLLNQVKEVKDVSFRIRLQAEIADTLWEYDEALARGNFKESYQAIAEIKPGKGMGAQTSLSGIEPQYQLRGELLKIISRRDSKLAREISGFIVDAQSKTTFDVNGDEQAKLYGQMALSLAESDPRLASDIGKIGLNQSTDPSYVSRVIGLLSRLRRENPAVADHLFTYALSKVQRDVVNLARNVDLLATYVFHDYGNPAIRYNLGLRGARTGKEPANRTLANQLLDTVFNAVMQLPYSTQLNADGISDDKAMTITIDSVNVTRRLLPYFNLYFPGRKAEAVRLRLTEASNSVSSGNLPVQVSDSSNQESVQDVIAKAELALTQNQRDSLYSRALTQIITEDGDLDQALPILDKMSNEGGKNWRSPLYQRASEAALNKGDIDTAIHFANNVEDFQQRASTLNHIAQILCEKKNIDRAGEVLDEAEQMVANNDGGLEAIQIMLSIAGTAMHVDPARSFSMVESAISRINQADSGKNAGTAPTVTSTSIVIARNFEKCLPLMAKSDFDRTWLLAQSIKKIELSLLAQLFVCRGVLVNAVEAGSRVMAKPSPPSVQRTTVQ